MSIFDKIFGTYSDRELKRIRPIADTKLWHLRTIWQNFQMQN